jgi:hypothetical protein
MKNNRIKNRFFHRKLRAGISLPELMIAMLMVGILMTATFYLFTNFFKITLAQERKTSVNSELQSSAQFLKWDLFMTGFGMNATTLPITAADNAGQGGSDRLTLRSVSFGMNGTNAKWTYILAPVQRSTSVVVRRWNNTTDDIAIGDYIAVLTPAKRNVGLPTYRVTGRTSTTGPSGQPAWQLTLSSQISTGLNFIFQTATTGPQSVVYQIQNGNLMRDTSLFIPGATDFQIAYWVDLDRDNVEDGGEVSNNLNALINNISLIQNINYVRFSIVSAAKGTEKFIYQNPTLTVENHTINTNLNVTGTDTTRRNFRYDVWTSVVKPRNL